MSDPLARLASRRVTEMVNEALVPMLASGAGWYVVRTVLGEPSAHRPLGRAELLVTTGGVASHVVREALDRIRSLVDGNPSCVVADVRVQVLAWSGGAADGWRPAWEDDDV